MPSDAIRLELRGDLRALRTTEGELSLERFATLHALIEQLGRGHIKDTFQEFLQLEEELGREVGSDLHAFFFTVGVGVGGKNLDDRLKKYVKAYHVGDRTAQRRTDRGLERLSHIIRDRSVMFRPEANITLIQTSYLASFTFELMVPRGTRYSLPDIVIDGEAQQVDEMEWDDVGDETNILTWKMDYGPIDMRGRMQNTLMKAEIEWTSALRASWRLSAALSDPRLYSRMRVDFGRSCTIELAWQLEDKKFDPGELIDFLFNFD